MTMKLKVPNFDGRTRMADHPHKVMDSDTDKAIGLVQGHQGPSLGPSLRWSISLFDGKYEGVFERHDECVAFAKGVEAVLNHMVSSNHQFDWAA
jgi:hypothetical protein